MKIILKITLAILYSLLYFKYLSFLIENEFYEKMSSLSENGMLCLFSGIIAFVLGVYIIINFSKNNSSLFYFSFVLNILLSPIPDEDTGKFFVPLFPIIFCLLAFGPLGGFYLIKNFEKIYNKLKVFFNNVPDNTYEVILIVAASFLVVTIPFGFFHVLKFILEK